MSSLSAPQKLTGNVSGISLGNGSNISGASIGNGNTSKIESSNNSDEQNGRNFKKNRTTVPLMDTNSKQVGIRDS